MAMSHNTFLIMVDKIAKVLMNYNHNTSEDCRIMPYMKVGFFMNQFPKEITDDGEEIEKIVDDTVDKIMPYIMHVNAKKFASEFPSPNNYASVLGDMLCVAMGGVGFCWEACPPLTELELLMADWYGQLLHLPSMFLSNGMGSKGGGCHQQTENDALYNCYLAARHHLIEGIYQIHSESDEKYVMLGKFVIYASEDAHLSVLTLCTVEHLILRQIKCDGEGNIDGDLLKETLINDKKAGLIPLMGIVTIGGFMRFGIDAIRSFKECQGYTHGFWIHVDATYGGCALMLPDQFINLNKDFELANSIAVTLSNFSPIAFDSTFLWVRRFRAFKKVFVINPAYLKHTPKGAVDLRNYGISLSRRFRAFKDLFTVRLLGANGIRDFIREKVEIANVFAKTLEKSSVIDIALNEYTIVHFRLKDSTNKDNRALYSELFELFKTMLLFPIKIDKKYYIRFTPSSSNMTRANAVEIAEQVIITALEVAGR